MIGGQVKKSDKNEDLLQEENLFLTYIYKKSNHKPINNQSYQLTWLHYEYEQLDNNLKLLSRCFPILGFLPPVHQIKSNINQFCQLTRLGRTLEILECGLGPQASV